jgi:type I pantothenate kinase
LRAAAGHNAPVTPYIDMHDAYVDLDRARWSRLRVDLPLALTESGLASLAGFGERIDLDEVVEVYLPLSRLVDLHVRATQQLRRATSLFLGGTTDTTPFVIGIAGSVAVGKSTTARILRHLIAQWPATPRVELVTTDGFLYSNAELERRDLLQRKGFPESYDRRALLQFLCAVKSGHTEVTAPVYSHLTYDIVPGERIVVRRPDVLIVEGLNVLQPARLRRAAGHRGRALTISDLFDFSIYVHARTKHIRRWYVERFLELRRTAFADPHSYFHRYAALSDEEAVATALELWAGINEPNLVENIKPTRERARLVLIKSADHAVARVRMRKL